MSDAYAFLRSQHGLAFDESGEWPQLAIVDRQAGTLYGDCAVRVLAEPPLSAEIGVTLARTSQGRGVATEALTVLAELFERRGTHRVFAETDDRNDAVGRLLERLGFRCEARLIDADWSKGEWATLRIYAILDAEWRDQQNALQ